MPVACVPFNRGFRLISTHLTWGYVLIPQFVYVLLEELIVRAVNPLHESTHNCSVLFCSVFFFSALFVSGFKSRETKFKALLSFLFVCLLQVFLAECAGPLIIYLMFYFRLPFIYSLKYDFTSSKHWVVQWVSACLCFRGSVAMSQQCIAQSPALHRWPLNMANTRGAYCCGDTESGQRVMDWSGAV